MLALAVVVFALLAGGLARRMMVYSEELSALPVRPVPVLSRALGPSGELRYQISCLDADAPRLVLTSSRPTLSLCAGQVAYPILAAPQYAGVWLWPLALLRPLHHDDPIRLRLLLLPIGALSILLTSLVIARFSSFRVASAAALGMAASPCLVLIHGVIQPYESLDWIFLMAAVLVLSGSPELAPPPRAPPSPPEPSPAKPIPSTKRLVAGAFLVGVATLASVKALFLGTPLLVLALRMGVPIRRIRPLQWLYMALAAALPLTLLLLPVALQGNFDYATGRGGNWIEVLMENLHHPLRRLGAAATDLVSFWSNVGAVLFRTPFSAVAYAAAALLATWALVDGLRTFRRGHGDLITAASALVFLAYFTVVLFLYHDFPSNYIPLGATFGVVTGCAAERLARRWEGKLSWALAAGAFAAPFAWSSAQMAAGAARMPFIANVEIERAVAAALVASPDSAAPPVTVTMLLAGVLDQMTGGRVTTLAAHDFINACEDEHLRDEEIPACVQRRWRILLGETVRERPRLVVLPVDVSLFNRGRVKPALVRAGLEGAARDLGLDCALVQSFDLPAGRHDGACERSAPLALLFRVSPRAPSGPSF